VEFGSEEACLFVESDGADVPLFLTLMDGGRVRLAARNNLPFSDSLTSSSPFRVPGRNIWRSVPRLRRITSCADTLEDLRARRMGFFKRRRPRCAPPKRGSVLTWHRIRLGHPS